MMTGFLGFWLYGNRSTANLTQTAPGVALLATSVPAVMDTWTAAPPEPTAVPATETVTLQPSPMPFSSLTPGSGATQIAGIDEMVLVFVPEGVFPMGAADQDQQAEVFEKPEHIVFLDSFWIDRIEVTNAMFSRFVNATGYVTEAETGAGWIWNGSDWEKTASADWRHPRGEGSSIQGKENFPVVQVTWDDAEAYCQWAGRRLPTEAEWEKAARGSDGRSYPWGSEAPNTQLLNYNDHIGDTTSAGSYPRAASPYGALDMAGNVWEWVDDWYDPEYYGNSPPENPPGPGSGVDRVMRGGSWHYNDPLIRTTYRGHIYPDYAGDSLGFRCAMSP
jgi:serine/threonine-protein kinase